MTGTFINIGAVLLGSLIGIGVGGRLPERMRTTVMDGLGLATIAIGLKMTLDTGNAVIMLGSLVLGGIVGEALDLDGAVTRLGEMMERLVLGHSRGALPQDGQKGRFAKGFVAASLIFCIGPMAIMGSIQDGLSGDYTMLSIKSMLDGFMSVLFASASRFLFSRSPLTRES